MKSVKLFLSLILALSGCQSVTNYESVPQIENKSLSNNQKFNQAIEEYTDQYLSEIIRVKIYDRDRVQKVFCIHHTAYVETAITAPNAITAYVRLFCVEGTPAIVTTGSMTNMTLTFIESKLSVDRLNSTSQEERFRVQTDSTPRGLPFYSEDYRQIFRADVSKRLVTARFNINNDYSVIRQKAAKYYQKKAKCS